jgi:FdhE protein
VSERIPRAPRAEPRELAELRQLRVDQPDLSSAIDMQIDLVAMQRRVQARVPLPRIQHDPAWLAAQQAAGRPAVRFADIPLEWSDFRLTFRQTADILRRHEVIDQADYEQILSLGRDGNALEPVVSQWYEATSMGGNEHPPRLPEGAPAGLDQILVLAIRPFLARCSEVLAQRADFSAWREGRCPYCGWEPDFAVITPSADRRLICGRCLGQWAFGAFTCPFCSNNDRALITSLATRDGRYRVYACDVCRRYLKAYDARNAARPVMPAVDSIATLPLDAAAMQKGYVG